MNKKVILLLMFICFICIMCGTNKVADDIQYITVKDTIELNNCYRQIDSLKHIIEKDNDILYNINITNDSLNTALDIKDDTIRYYKQKYITNEYKLKRIKQYNSIAAKRNNIKYLRGWINRVINE